MEAGPKNALGVLNGLERQLEDAAGSERDSEEGKARRPVAEWTVAEVCSWLSSGPLGAQGRPLLEAARGHAISGKALLRLTEATLERMEVVPGGLRRELMHEVLRLRIQQAMEDLLDVAEE